MYTLYIKFDDDLSDEIKQKYINIKKVNEDAGVDLYCPEDIEVSTLNTINHKIKCCMINNTTNTPSSYYLYPRSSISKYPLMLANHIGIIDSGYRGNILAKVRYLLFADPDIKEFFSIIKGQRLFQICSPDLTSLNIKIVDELPKSQRGENGFGSTGN